MLHLYIGDGKGKTTAAMGLAIRGYGAGKRVLVVQFLKGGSTGEVQALQQLSIPVLRNSRRYGFFATLAPAEREALTKEQNAMLQTVLEDLRQGTWDCVILDEGLDAWNNHSLSHSLLLDCLQFSDGTEMVLTGRNPDPILLQRADYITECKKLRHPFDRGIPAREGVEY